ncbi:DUF3301 domain-containing protein [Dyella sp. GSA-30]|uniref:DUF3301 domain-containing protein n=1 Tax=Dyella sp. GSA-30 TaxID=2994496 RepID=UPI002490EDE7|nr:DUF3301 domain-containing protein [Dyella sp. GSA-30]BDU20469.1 hypothetical protein DYGSA30_19260 [Dyella sp. GSA-30]
MGELSDLFLLLALLTIVGLWLKLNRAREQATAEARQQCLRHGLQLLDETVGLRSLRLRRVGGRLGVERCYSFEVSIDGDDREPGRLWLIGTVMTGLSLPTIELYLPEAPPRVRLDESKDNVVPLRPRDRNLH